MKKNLIEATAKLCHEANRQLCVLNDDNTQKSWDDADDWQRKAAIEGVAQAMKGVTSEELHNTWMDAKKKDGWVYGPEKDAVKKTHPDMIPYEKLSAFGKAKDHLFNGIVELFVKSVVESIR